MLAAEGTVGAVLISGGPLIAVGQVAGTGRAFLAGGGLALALLGVGVAIWFTGKVLSPRLTTTETVRSSALDGLRRMLEAQPAQFFGVVATSVDALLLHQEIAVDLARKVGAEHDPIRRQMIRWQLRRAERNTARAAPYVRWVLALAHVWLIEKDLRRSRLAAMVGGLFVVVGAVLFFIADGNGPTYVPVLTPLWGFRTRSLVLTWALCGSLVFVDEAAEDGPSLDSFLGEVDGRVVGPGRME